MKRVCVLIVNWNGWADTIECLESVFRLDYPDFRVIVCDNGSTDDSVERIADWAAGRLPVPTKTSPDLLRTHDAVAKPLDYAIYDQSVAEAGGDRSFDPPLVLVRLEDNLGFAGGNNVGLRYVMARDGFAGTWLLNNDTVVASGALEALVERMQTKPSAGMCGSTLFHYQRPDRIQARGGGWYCKWIGLPWHLGQLQRAGDPPRQQRVEAWMNYIVGASLLVSREFLEAVGLMCEDYFLYFEELDWALRGQGRFTLAYAPESVVYHKVGRSVGTSTNPRRKSLLCDYYAIRNRLLFTRRFFREALPTVYLSVLVAVFSRFLCGRADAAIMIWQILLGDDKGMPKQISGKSS